MDRFIIEGPCRLKGEVRISGSKNASLPIIVATILAPGTYNLKNVPDLRDIKTILTILKGFGISFSYSKGSLTIDTHKITGYKAPYELIKTMRASIYCMGPLLARVRKAEVALPGGCAIGVRPVDLHLKGFQKLGAKISLKEGTIYASAKTLKGTEIYLEKTSVGATANILMAAVLASGTTKIYNASMDPDVIDLIHFLKKMGASIEGEGTNVITIHGRKKLNPADYTIMPDRIEAGTFLIASAITAGEVTLKNCKTEHLTNVFNVLTKTGCRIITKDSSTVTIYGPKRPSAVDITTSPWPGFPTDLQPQMTALLSIAKGVSIINETIFENRFLHIAELNRMGANIQHDDSIAIVNGVKSLKGAPVMASDLRNGASLVIAALKAKGKTIIDRIYHIDRGYERLEEKLCSLGAKIKRVKT